MEELSGVRALRFNQVAEVDGMAPYADVRVRQALMMAVDNAVLLELGSAGLGTQADNHHVAPVHPEYADIGRPPYDPSASVGLLEDAGMAGFEHELITLNIDGGCSHRFCKRCNDARETISCLLQ
ncbi:MAG: hypothetical protein JJT81_09675 [Rubellimicrobium sp.]|nr:hypothetical protein [Rubellimicrobium sp.]